MAELTLHVFDWVPEGPRGFVRDLRVRWALEEAGLPYRIAAVPFEARGPDHLACQPFGQVPWLTDGDLSIFESGAILLHLGGLSEALLPADPQARAKAIEWLFAALNSVEMAVLPISILKMTGEDPGSSATRKLHDFLWLRLGRMEPILAEREWLAGSFSVADILMADVLRLTDRGDRLANYPACRAYVARATARPAFVKAHADQLAFYAASVAPVAIPA